MSRRRGLICCHGEYGGNRSTSRSQTAVHPSHLRRHQSMGHSWTGLHPSHDTRAFTPTYHRRFHRVEESVKRTGHAEPWNGAGLADGSPLRQDPSCLLGEPTSMAGGGHLL
jgi:hypothetical protein